ncbi:MAG: hypothetical protein V4755_18425, partial [Curtobacterium sp.]
MSTMIVTTPATTVSPARTPSARPGDGGAAFGDVLAGAGARSGDQRPRDPATESAGATSPRHTARRPDGVHARATGG